MAAKSEDSNALKFTATDRAEILGDARKYCVAAGIKKPTATDIRRVIVDNHGEEVATVVCGNAIRTVTAPTKAARKLRTVFGFSVISVARKLGLEGWKPAAAVKAIHRYEPNASVNAVKTFVHAGRHGLRGDPAPLTKTQLKQLAAAA